MRTVDRADFWLRTTDLPDLPLHVHDHIAQAPAQHPPWRTDPRVRLKKPPESLSLFARARILIGLLGLSALLTLPLGWKEQAVFGAALIAAAALLSRTSRSPTVTMALMIVSLFSTFRYAYWRATQTWDGLTSAGHLYRWDTAFVLILLAAEFYAFITLALGYFQTARPLGRRPAPLTGDPRTWPAVDVYIPTYNEPLSVVRATVLAALNLDYPAGKLNVVVLDDGRREEFREFAERMGAGYVTRSTNAHAKAGNLNHALACTRGEFIAIFDCDHAPTGSFLQTTLGWFMRDPRLGLVQTPHHFCSPDPFERNLGQFRRVPNEGELFHRLVQDGNDLWNASFFCGSCAVLRRRALNEIGGIAVETVTEDAHTALRMQRRGWNTAYINVPQAAGLATESLSAHIAQRIRWARGMVQILRLENPLFARGLSLPQRLCYFNASTHFLFAVPRLIFLTIPLVYLLLGMVNIYGYSLAIFAYAFPHIVIAHVTNSRIQRQYRFSFWNEIYEAVLAPYILVPTLLALINPRLGRFNVTAKGGTLARSYFDRRVALPFLVLLALNIAGLVKGGQRYMTDPAHHDTILMNALWTVYNVVILSVAASVAWERRQRRSEVRVDVRVPMTLATADGRRLTGTTRELSQRGATGRLDRRIRLPRGAPVLVTLDADGTPCDIPARVSRSAGREQHLSFRNVAVWQEQYLVGLIYSPPDAWAGWNSNRRLDRPLRGLFHILWLSLRAIVVVMLGLLDVRPTPRAREAPRQARRRVPVIAAGVVLFEFFITPSTLGAQAAAAAPATRFLDRYELGAITSSSSLALSGPGAALTLTLSVPITKIVGEATLNLHYAAPALRGSESSLELWLNGTRVGAVPLAPGADVASEVPLPTDLLNSDNTLQLRLQGSCAACAAAGVPWITLNRQSSIVIAGTRLALADDLSLLPVPFFDATGQHEWKLPVVFSERPDSTALEAAAVVASWFGVLSDIRFVRFPVTIGALPDGNAIVIALGGSELASHLSLGSHPGALLAVRNNPRDPFGKLLIVAGDEPVQLLAGARALVTADMSRLHSAVASVGDVSVPPRDEYGAPRWLDAGSRAPIGMYTSDERLKVAGSGSVNVYFRLPPDLFLPARSSVPLLLKYGYGGVSEGSSAALHVRLNGQDVDTVALGPAPSSVEKSVIVQLPTGRLRPYTNTLTVDFDFGRRDAPGHVWPYGAVHRDSWIDLRGLPHSVVLPRLELFADAGYPFTAWPDLGRTAVVLPSEPTPVDYEVLLDMVAFFGGQTGAPATAITVTDPAHVDSVGDKDIVVLGDAASQPLLFRWADRMPLDLSAKRLRVNPSPMPSRWIHPEWPLRDEDRDRLLGVLDNDARPDVIVEHFVSPFRPDRSVVSIVARDAGGDPTQSLFAPAARRGPVYGGLALAANGQFQSFLVGTAAYHAGRLNPYQRSRVFLFENYRLLPLFVMLLALLVGPVVREKTERVAARRLQSVVKLQRRTEGGEAPR